MAVIDSDSFDGEIADGGSETLAVSTSDGDSEAVLVILDDGTEGGEPPQYDITFSIKSTTLDRDVDVFTDASTTSRQQSIGSISPEMSAEVTNTSGSDADFGIEMVAADGRVIQRATASGQSFSGDVNITGGDDSVIDLQNPAGDISGGVTADPQQESRTLFLNTAGAIDITVELSPDGGSNFYEIDESPIEINSATDRTVEFGYDFDRIKLTGSNTTDVLAQIFRVA